MESISRWCPKGYVHGAFLTGVIEVDKDECPSTMMAPGGDGRRGLFADDGTSEAKMSAV